MQQEKNATNEKEQILGRSYLVLFTERDGRTKRRTERERKRESERERENNRKTMASVNSSFSSVAYQHFLPSVTQRTCV